MTVTCRGCGVEFAQSHAGPFRIYDCPACARRKDAAFRVVTDLTMGDTPPGDWEQR